MKARWRQGMWKLSDYLCYLFGIEGSGALDSVVTFKGLSDLSQCFIKGQSPSKLSIYLFIFRKICCFFGNQFRETSKCADIQMMSTQSVFRGKGEEQIQNTSAQLSCLPELTVTIKYTLELQSVPFVKSIWLSNEHLIPLTMHFGQ